MRPGISFVVPVLDGEATIARCLDAIYEQTLLSSIDFEVIVVDNGSSDATLAILEARKDISLAHEDRQGRSHARNHGASLARYSHLAFIDCDTILAKDWAGLLWSQLRPPFVIGQTKIETLLGPSSGGAIFPAPDPYFVNSQSPLQGIDSAAMMIKSEDFHRFGQFDPSYPRAEDTELTMRLTRAGGGLLVVDSTGGFKCEHRHIFSRIHRSFRIGFFSNRIYSNYICPIPKSEILTSLRQTPVQSLNFYVKLGMLLSAPEQQLSPTPKGWHVVDSVAISKDCFFIKSPSELSLRRNCHEATITFTKGHPCFQQCSTAIEQGQPFVRHFIRAAEAECPEMFDHFRERLLL